MGLTTESNLFSKLRKYKNVNIVNFVYYWKTRIKVYEIEEFFVWLDVLDEITGP